MTAFDYTKDEVYMRLVAHVLKVEGGYANDPKDKGGPTKFGIAWNKNTAALKKLGFVNPTDIKNLTKEQALELYYWKYWQGSGADVLAAKSVRLAYMHFDTYVNGGGAKCLAQLSTSPKYYEGYPKNQVLWLRLFIEYIARRCKHFTGCSTWNEHGKGWINRLASVILFALTLES